MSENDIEREALVLLQANAHDEFCAGCGRIGCDEFGCTDVGPYNEPKVDNSRPSCAPVDQVDIGQATRGKHVACDACGLEMRGQYLTGDPCPRTMDCVGELGAVCAECKAINSGRYTLCEHAQKEHEAAYAELCERRRVKP